MKAVDSPAGAASRQPETGAHDTMALLPRILRPSAAAVVAVAFVAGAALATTSFVGGGLHVLNSDPAANSAPVVAPADPARAEPTLDPTATAEPVETAEPTDAPDATADPSATAEPSDAPDEDAQGDDANEQQGDNNHSESQSGDNQDVQGSTGAAPAPSANGSHQGQSSGHGGQGSGHDGQSGNGGDSGGDN